MPNTLQKLLQSVHHLERARGDVELSLAIAKRVQRESRMLVRELAAQRDENATVLGGHKQ